METKVKNKWDDEIRLTMLYGLSRAPKVYLKQTRQWRRTRRTAHAKDSGAVCGVARKQAILSRVENCHDNTEQVDLEAHHSTNHYFWGPGGVRRLQDGLGWAWAELQSGRWNVDAIDGVGCR
jgi:hypothetical protein